MTSINSLPVYSVSEEVSCKVPLRTLRQQSKNKNMKSTILNMFLCAWPNKLLAASETLHDSPSSLALPVDSVYLLICVATERLWHPATPPGSLGDTTGHGDFGFLATAVKLHSDDETAVRLCLWLTVGCWCLCDSVRLRQILTDERACKYSCLATANTSSDCEAIVTVICLCSMGVCVCVSVTLYRLTSPHYSLLPIFILIKKPTKTR